MDPSMTPPDPGIAIKKEVPLVLPSSSLISKDLKASLGPAKGGSSSRLPSFKGPRDLTLSALAASTAQPQVTRVKKTFVPNIPIRREKGEKVVDSKSEKSGKKTSGKNKQEGKRKGKWKEKEFVQTRGSLFGEGIASAPLKRGSASYGGFGPGGGGGGGGGGGAKIGEMQKPVLNTEAAYNVDKDVEDKKLKEILRDDFVEDPEDEVSALDVLPVQLPMISSSAEVKKQESSEIKINVEKRRKSLSDEAGADAPESGIKVKQEPGTEDKSFGTCNGLPTDGNKVFEPAGSMPPHSVANILLNKAQGGAGLMFFQLPSCLPGHPPDVKVELPPPQQPGTSGPSAGTREAPSNGGGGTSDGPVPARAPLCTLDSLPEGQIGSLKIYESGKVELCLGEHQLEITRGTEVGFLQDAVRIQVEPDSQAGSMVVLGHVDERFVCTPQFGHLVAARGGKRAA